MEISDLILRKEEIPIIHESCFELPIHPLLINPETMIDVGLASKVFPQAAEEWYEDLKAYRETKNLCAQTKEWYDNFLLNEKPEVKVEYGRQSIFDGVWVDDVELNDNGFARGLSISRNSGGTIYFNEGEHNCQIIVRLGSGGVLKYIKFPEEKAREFGFEEMELDSGKIILAHAYAHHNIDYYPGALFLRNWGILYLNEALKSIL